MATIKQTFRLLKSKRYRNCRIKTMTLSNGCISDVERMIKFLEWEGKEGISFGIFTESVLNKSYELLKEEGNYIKWLEGESK